MHSVWHYGASLMRAIAGRISAGSTRSMTLGGRRYRSRTLVLGRAPQTNDHETWMDAVYSAALRTKSGVFIDVGANIGQTLVKILSIDADRGYLGFEPQLDCSFFVESFIRDNDLRHHSVLPVGLSNRNDVVQLLKRSADADTTASTIRGFRPDGFYSSRQPIYVARGDDVILGLDPPEIAVIKIDVEGGELEVVEGLVGTIDAYRPFVFFEVLNHFLVATGADLDPTTIEFREERNKNLEKILREKRYSIFNILPDNRVTEIAEIRPTRSDDLRITDYVAVPDEAKAAFLGLCPEQG